MKKSNDEKIVFASSNQGKINELKTIFPNSQVLSLKDIGYEKEIIENGKSFFDNALIKAKAVSGFLKEKNIFMPVIADDSGLCVDILKGKPGIKSARYSGKNATNQKNRAKLLKALENKTSREAHFQTCIVKLYPNGKCFVGNGKTFGEILKEEKGANNFGYDPIFFSHDLKKTFGEASMEEKNTVSHRYRAILDLIQNEKDNNFLTI